METSDKKLKETLKKFEVGTSTPDERKVIEQWYAHRSAEMEHTEDNGEYIYYKHRIWDQLNNNNNRRFWTKIAAGMMLIPMAVYLIYYADHIVKPNTEHQQITDIAPGSQKAILVLPGGKKVTLDSSNSSALSKISALNHEQSTRGAITYKKGLNDQHTENHQIITPRGGTYHVTLSDGTRVWLNAQTKLSYPASFSSGIRQVTLIGEAYFEVEKDKMRPFQVITSGQITTVLGTHFNIKGYPDEDNIHTTLLEGKVKVSDKQSFAVLSPGEESISSDEDPIRIQKTDTTLASAWHYDRILFKKATIKEILAQASRWYDFEVSYPDGVPTGTFSGGMSRKSKLSALLEILRSSGIAFKIEKLENKTILVVHKSEHKM
ncbi:FecR family protein [Pedobacter paludis]|uniref:Anti-sigma factor n=1 Tax=Pedobacter paludis TaxID=2203212 RepID=A0A317EZF7_9SPHI|nr:FecR domain-containing protein [Pedobacter paludis]PWS32244.1 hypothetical protein DF947_10780 [Pedobacter paludis]